jgi:hypothetical protein
MKNGRYGVSSIANANPLAPRKENAIGKRQQLNGRKESMPETSDPPVVTVIFEGFLISTSLPASAIL